MASSVRPRSSPIDTDQGLVGREAAQRFLLERINYEQLLAVPYGVREFKLDRMRSLLRRLGNPHRQLRVIHVAGTKGKGSTTAMLGAVLSAAGYRTGTFTSPHLDRIEQRMAVDGSPCPADQFAALVQRVMPAVEAMDTEAATQSDPTENRPTYFEVITALAMLHFVRQDVDLAVLEVGLGGRLDSTNVSRPDVSIITSISLDHTQLLGDTLEAIAWEKAGIVKPDVPLVSGVVAAGPREVIRQVCREQSAPLVEVGADFHFDYRPPTDLDGASALPRLDVHGQARGQPYSYQDLSLALLGRHQGANAAVAVAAIVELAHRGWDIPEKAVRRGMAEAVCPARIELLARRPAVVVDTAHNRASVEALIQTLRESMAAQRRLLIFATTQEKDVRGMLPPLLDSFDEVVFTRYRSNPRSVPPAELRAMAVEMNGQSYPVFEDPIQAWNHARRAATPEDLICVTGSFFIAAELRRHLGASDSSTA